MPKLTKEEKKARKLEKAAEKLRIEEEAKLQRKKDQIKREVAMQELSQSQMDRSWRHFMIQLKLPFFRNEIKAIWSIFERVMDKKEAVLNQLRHQMREADHQQRLSLASFSDSVDLQLQRFYTVLEDMDKIFDHDSKALRKRGEEERLNVEAIKDRAEWSMAVLRWAMAQGDKEAGDHFQGESVVKYFEKDLMYNNDREDLENTLERRFTFISDLYKELLKDYFTKSADNRKKLEKLRPKDTIMMNIIIKQERRTGENFITLKKLRQVVQSYEDGTVMAGVRDNYKRNRDAYTAAKNKMDADLKLDTDQFADLVEINNETIQWLKGVAKKGDQIVTASRLCRKLQTGPEIAGMLRDDEPLLKYSEATESPRMNKTLESYDELKTFWALVAEAEISRKSLQDERNKLTRENDLLREYFKEWMEEHKYGTKSYEPPSQQLKPFSVVEAAHEFSKIGYQIE